MFTVETDKDILVKEVIVVVSAEGEKLAPLDVDNPDHIEWRRRHLSLAARFDSRDEAKFALKELSEAAKIAYANLCASEVR